ncbi:hypothetical protein [Capillimicrobium parvum]|uniref:Uncharacterized protein n=1 Tax=Capillimicrobium parvum TaxID=2884022 RepID=A0A9E6XXS7_9ACTN|nr:hypothetical protein [Capillimicrobium parvum]UGS36459.1 hypothetical protein DSM104329_02865 [Capillimicrobium parvum]
MKVNDLLLAALKLLDQPIEDAEGTWPHAAAVLTRQAIEETMSRWWKHVEPDMNAANWNEKWLALPSYLGRSPVVGEAHYAWSVLSDACHHRAYEIGLTEAELRSLLIKANDFARLVSDRLANRQIRIERVAAAALPVA